MGGPISVVLSNTFCAKMECDVVKQLKPKLYKRCVDDIHSKRNKTAKHLEKFNYRPNIKFAIEVNPCKFLDIELKIKMVSLEHLL